MAVKATQKNILWQKNTFFLFLFICWLPVLKIPNDKDSILSVTMCHTHIICLFFVKFRSRIFPGILYFQLLFLKDSHRKKSQHKPRYWAIEMGNWSISLYGSKIMGDEDDNNKWRWYIYRNERQIHNSCTVFVRLRSHWKRLITHTIANLKREKHRSKSHFIVFGLLMIDSQGSFPPHTMVYQLNYIMRSDKCKILRYLTIVQIQAYKHTHWKTFEHEL